MPFALADDQDRALFCRSRVADRTGVELEVIGLDPVRENYAARSSAEL
jgi:hypothetical protein